MSLLLIIAVGVVMKLETYNNCWLQFSGPEVFFKTCIAIKFVDDDDDDGVLCVCVSVYLL